MEETKIPQNNDSATKSNLEPTHKLHPNAKVSFPIAIGLLIVAAAAVAYYVQYNQPKGGSVGEPPTGELNSAPPAGADNLATVTNRQLSGQVTWSSAEEIDPLDIFSGTEGSQYPRENSKFYRVGEIARGKYQGADVILADVAYEGPTFYPTYFRLLRNGNEIIYLEKHSHEYFDVAFDLAKFKVDKDFTIPDLGYPDTLQGVTNRQTFELDKYAAGIFSADGLVKMFTHPIYGDVYSDKVADGDESGRPSKYGFYLKVPDSTVKIYKLNVDFIGTDNVPQITWNDSSANKNEYAYTTVGGCGSSNYLAVVSPQTVNLDRDLQVAGENSFDDLVYEFKDSNNQMLRDIYDNQYVAYAGEKVSYADFIKNHPVFFWKDPFGRLVKFHNNKFVPLAECGKPVIYLYPQKPQEVAVRLNPPGGFSYTEPVYNGAWRVFANTSGQLTDLETGKKYPYLFWEGRGGIYKSTDKGFVVEREGVAEFLKQKLALQGLNEKEINDFIEFWLPRMQGSPYYFVTFFGNQVMDSLAPLQIEPMPDTVIRVLMDFRPLEHPIPVVDYDFVTPQRNGFTVVEWGGVLRR